MSWLFDDRREQLLRRYIEDRLEPDEKKMFEELCREDPDLRQEAHTLKDQARLLGRAPEVETPPDLAASIMDRVSSAKPPGRAYAFLFRPRTVRVRVMTGLVAAAAVAAIVVLVVWGGVFSGNGGHDTGAGTTRIAGSEGPGTPVDDPGPPGKAASEEPGPGLLAFRVAVEEASRVTLVGDFNGWSEEGTELVDEDGDGVWRLEIEASAGRYKYRFLVDGETWIDDPGADAQVDDGFGGTNSVRYVL